MPELLARQVLLAIRQCEEVNVEDIDAAITGLGEPTRSSKELVAILYRIATAAQSVVAAQDAWNKSFDDDIADMDDHYEAFMNAIESLRPLLVELAHV
jgi:hypothetical protein